MKKKDEKLFNLLMPYFNQLEDLSVEDINIALSILTPEEKDKINKVFNGEKVSYKKLFLYISGLVDISLLKKN